MNAQSIICRLCLVADVQMFNLNNDNLRNCYYNLTGVMNLGMCPYICYECLALLKRFGNFRRKCLTADQILKNVNIRDIRKIDRELTGLTSTLIFTNCMSVTINSLDDLKTENEDIIPDIKMELECDTNFYKEIDDASDEKFDTYFYEELDASDENQNTNFNEELDVNFDKELNPNDGKLDTNIYEELDTNFYKELNANDVKLNTNFIEELNVNLDEELYANDEKLDTSFNEELYAKYEKLNTNFDELDANFDEELDANDEKFDTNINEELDVNFDEEFYANDEKLYSNFYEELDINFDNNGDDTELNFNEDNTNVSDTTAILEDHSYSLNDKIKHKVLRTKKRNKLLKRKNNFDYLKGVATITLLSPEDARKALGGRKQTIKYLKSKFKCHFCYRGYSLRSSFDNHLKIHNPKESKYECDYCCSKYRSRLFIRTHLEDYHTWKFECNTCSHVCFDVYTAKDHYAKKHTKKYFKCDNCSIIFTSYKSMLTHKRYKHALNTVPCVLCGDTFSTDPGLKIHAQVVHFGETEEPDGPYCDLCDVRFATDVAWKRHFVLSDKHEDIINGCETCGEVFDTREEVRKHAREYKHFNNGRTRARWPLACRYCTKLLADIDEYEFHMKKEHPNTLAIKSRGGARESRGGARESRGGARESRGGARESSIGARRRGGGESSGGARGGGVAKEKKILICDLCGKQFKAAYFLKTHHQEKHNDGSPQFKCKICGKPFSSYARSITHVYSHASVDERTCEVCRKVFKDKTHLKVHISRVHFNVRPHKCTICEKAFPTACEVKYHVGHVHFKVPWKKRNRSHQVANEEDN